MYFRSPKAAYEMAEALGIRFRAPDQARTKFEAYRYFKNTKSKKAKNMQLVEAMRAEKAERELALAGAQ